MPRGTLISSAWVARTGHRLSSFADGSDGSDCPTIGPDGECCRYIGQALLLTSLGMSKTSIFFDAITVSNVLCPKFYVRIKHRPTSSFIEIGLHCTLAETLHIYMYIYIYYIYILHRFSDS